MEIFKALSGVKNEVVTSNLVKEFVYPEINGELVIKKGVVTMSINFFGKVTPMHKLKHLTCTEDFDFETNSTTIEGMVIDSFDKFCQGLRDHGMKSVADSLMMTDEEILKEVYKILPTHKYYKALYGDAVLFENLTIEEQKLEYVKALREDKTLLDNSDYLKNKYGWKNEEGGSLNADEILELYKTI